MTEEHTASQRRSRWIRSFSLTSCHAEIGSGSQIRQPKTRSGMVTATSPTSCPDDILTAGKLLWALHLQWVTTACICARAKGPPTAFGVQKLDALSLLPGQCGELRETKCPATCSQGLCLLLVLLHQVLLWSSPPGSSPVPWGF